MLMAHASHGEKPEARVASVPNLWHLFVFRAVARRGAVTAAAAELGLTQPAASQALKNLQEFFGAELMERRDGRLVLTEAGRLLEARAVAAFALLGDALRDAAGGKDGETHLLRAMSARRLETLVSIVRHGGFADAARADGFAAPTVHRAAKDLERAIGATLFETTSHGVKPTKKAETLATKAGLAFAELRQAQDEIAYAQGRGAGRTVIGAMPLGRAHLVPAAVVGFSKKHPHHKVSVVEGAYEDLLISLRRGETDMLVGAMRDNPSVKDVEEITLFEDPLSIVMRAGHPAAQKNNLDSETLARFPWIAPRATSPLHAHFKALFEELDLPVPEDVIECNSLGACRVMLMNSDRLMLLSDEQIRYEKAAEMLVSRPHPGGRVVRPIGLTIRRGWRPTETQSALIAHIQAEASEMSAARPVSP